MLRVLRRVTTARRLIATLALLVFTLAVVPPGAAQSETLIVTCPANIETRAAALKAALTLANSDEAAQTISLASGCIYTLTGPDNFWYGPNGLPAIVSPITIEGNGAVIERAAPAPPFRLFYVAGDLTDGVTPGQLTLRNLTLRGGLARGGAGAESGGGGGAGLGGAIFSQGAVTLENVTLTANLAQGGQGAAGRASNLSPLAAAAASAAAPAAGRAAALAARPVGRAAPVALPPAGAAAVALAAVALAAVAVAPTARAALAAVAVGSAPGPVAALTPPPYRSPGLEKTRPGRS